MSVAVFNASCACADTAKRTTNSETAMPRNFIFISHARFQSPIEDAVFRLSARDPVRLPLISHQTGSSDYSNHLSDVPSPVPRRIERVLMSIASPHQAFQRKG